MLLVNFELKWLVEEKKAKSQRKMVTSKMYFWKVRERERDPKK